LTERDRDELVQLVDADPLVNAVLSSRLHAMRSVHPRVLGGELLGARTPDGVLRAVVFDGGNLLPIGGGPDEWQLLARALVPRARRATSIIGARSAVQAMWGHLEPSWGPARAVRSRQPVLALHSATGLPAGDRRVRPIRGDELDRYLPAAAAMFAEELGISPYRDDPTGYRQRVAGLITQRRAFGVVEAGEVVFKADLGAVSPHTCQVQGIWVRPDLRGRGLGTAATAAVLRHALTLAPSVSLYVNDFNTAARRMYERLGMREAATLATVLL
jgi:predicted GNAT family acetyltransferase